MSKDLTSPNIAALHEQQEHISDNIAKLKQLEPLIMNAELGLVFFDQNSYAVVIVDENFMIVLVNTKAELLFGYHRSEMLNHNVNMLLPQGLIEKHKAYQVSYDDDPRPRLMGAGITGLKARKKNGREVEVEIELLPVSTAKGRYTIATVRRRA
jgi:PAS domain S-box-containing protein